MTLEILTSYGINERHDAIISKFKLSNAIKHQTLTVVLMNCIRTNSVTFGVLIVLLLLLLFTIF